MVVPRFSMRGRLSQLVPEARRLALALAEGKAYAHRAELRELDRAARRAETWTLAGLCLLLTLAAGCRATEPPGRYYTPAHHFTGPTDARVRHVPDVDGRPAPVKKLSCTF